MLKIANQIIDAYDDIHKDTLKKLAAIRPDCKLMTPEELGQLKDHDHAVCVITKKASKLNKFPINNMDNTWLSNEFFQRTHPCLPEEAAKIAASNIKLACMKYKIKTTPAVEKYASKDVSDNVYFEKDYDLKPVNMVNRVDLTKFAQVKNIGENYTVAQQVFSTPSHVKVAADYFKENIEKIPLDLRHKYAAAIQRRARELGMPVITGEVGKYASDYYSPMVDAHIKARNSLLETKPDLRETLQKISSAKKDIPPSQFAQLLHGFDKKAGLSKYYGGHLTDPYIASFAYEANPYDGYVYKTASMSMGDDEIRAGVNAHYGKIKEYFGQSIADELKKDPVPIFDSLPNDAKEMIGRIMSGNA